jgi:HB1, ASXL, restriction endonuclease HTH domain
LHSSESDIYFIYLISKERSMADLKERLQEVLREPTESVAQAERAARAAEALAAYLRLERGVSDLLGLAEPVSEAASGNLSGLTLHDAAEAVLRDAGTPLHVGELGRRIKAGGWRHKRSPNPRHDQINYQLAARLPRHPDVFVRVAPNTFGLIGWDQPSERKRPPIGLFSRADGPTGEGVGEMAEEAAAAGKWRSS